MDLRLVDYLQSIGASPDSLAGWSIKVAQRSGLDVAFVCTLGTEIHFVSLVGPRAMSRKNIAQFMAPLIAEYGYATTRVSIDETNHKLREHLGFVESWSDNQYRYFICTELPYTRSDMKHTEHKEAPCQSPL
jgi:hypothetical protein